MIVDKALQARRSRQPCQGWDDWCWLYRGIANQIKSVPGMEIVAISIGTWMELSEPMLKLALRKFVRDVVSLKMPLPKQYAVTDDAMLSADGIDALIEVTGTIEFGVHVEAIATTSTLF